MPARAERFDPLLTGLAAGGLLLALLIGAAAGTGHGALVGAAIVSLTLLACGVVVYVRDPVRGLIWLWIALILNAPLAVLAGYDSAAGAKIRQSDEVLVLLLVCLTAMRALQHGTRLPWRFAIPALAVAVLGLISAETNHVPLGISVSGAWLGLKLWIMVIVALMLPWGRDDLGRVYRAVMTAGVLIAALGLAEFATNGAVLNALHLQGLEVASENPRAGAIHSIFYHAGDYSLFMSILFAFAFVRFSASRRKEDLLLAILFAVSVLLTLRLKGFLSLAAVVAIVVLAQQAMHGRRRASAALVGALLVIGVYSVETTVIHTQVSEYSSPQTTARGQLYSTGEKIAADQFPLGAGFGRFASYPSRTTYSPLYDQYALSSTWGLSRRYPQFIDDTSWPSVIGETGYLGFAAYCLGLVLLAWTLARRIAKAPEPLKWAPLAALCVLAVIIVNSLGDPSLFNWVPAASLALILGPALIATRAARPR